MSTPNHTSSAKASNGIESSSSDISLRCHYPSSLRSDSKSNDYTLGGTNSCPIEVNGLPTLSRNNLADHEREQEKSWNDPHASSKRRQEKSEAVIKGGGAPLDIDFSHPVLAGSVQNFDGMMPMERIQAGQR